MNTLGIDTLQKEKTQLQEDFSKLGVQVKQVETDLGQMKANLNAINGALQEVNKLIGLVEVTKPKDLTKKEK
jgi:uncharacterized protein YlxW (UPF0749 family)